MNTDKCVQGLIIVGVVIIICSAFAGLAYLVYKVIEVAIGM